MPNFIGLDRGFPVLATYNSSAAAGVTKFRVVKFSVSSSTAFIDLQTSPTGTSLGVVQDDMDQTKVAKSGIANVRLGGISYIFANTTPGAIAIGSRVAAGTVGGVKLAVTSDIVVGICIGMSVPGGTVAAGDLIAVYLTPGYIAAP
jgi:hypothetical protein